MQQHSEDHSLQGNARIGGQRQASGAVPVIAETVERECDERDDRTGQHRQPRDSSRVEGASINRLCRPQEKRERIEGKEESCLAHILGSEASSAEDQAGDGLCQRDHGGGGKQTQGYNAGDGIRDAHRKLIALALRPKLRKEGQRSGSRGQREHGHGRGEELFGVGQTRDIAAAVRGEVARKVRIKKGQRKAEHERQCHVQPLPQAGMAEVNAPAVAHAGTGRSPGVQSKRPQKETGGCSDGQRLYSQPAVQQHAGRDDAEVVKNGRHRLIEKLPAHQQRGSQHAPGKEAYLSRK